MEICNELVTYKEKIKDLIFLKNQNDICKKVPILVSSLNKYVNIDTFCDTICKFLAKMVFYLKPRKTIDCLSGSFLVKKEIGDTGRPGPLEWKIGLKNLIAGDWSTYPGYPYMFAVRKNVVSNADLKQGLLLFSHLFSLFTGYHFFDNGGLYEK